MGAIGRCYLLITSGSERVIMCMVVFLFVLVSFQACGQHK